MSDYLLVHGGFNGGWVWDDVAERLEKAGHEVRVVDQLPSAGTNPASLGDLTTDANHVRQVLDTIDEPVVLVGHSYGGMVITELADRPKVRHSVYLPRFGRTGASPCWTCAVMRRCRIGSLSGMTARWRSPTISSWPGSRCARTWTGPAPEICSLAVCCNRRPHLMLQAQHPIGHIRRLT